MLLRWYLARRDPGWLEGGEFEGLRWPLGLSVVFVAAGLSVLAPPVRSAGSRLLVLAFFFVLQGLAVVAFYANRLGDPGAAGCGAGLVLVTVGAAVLALLGHSTCGSTSASGRAPRSGPEEA